MRFRTMIALALAAVLAFSLTPSRAANYTIDYGVLQGVTAKLKMWDGKAEVWLTNIAGVNAYTEATTGRPQPVSVDYYFGCIKVWKGSSVDEGCGPLEGATISTGGLAGGSVLFTVPSKYSNNGQKLEATLVFSGTASAPEVAATPAVSREGTTNYVRDGLVLKRGAEATGLVYSARLNNQAPVRSTTEGYLLGGTGGVVFVTAP